MDQARTVTTTPDLTLTGSLLVAQYNEMVATAIDLGIPGVREVNRFATNSAGVQRTEKLHATIQNFLTAETEVKELEAHKAKVAAADTPETSGETTSQGNPAPEDTDQEAERLPGETEEAYMARKAKKKAAGKKAAAPRKSGGAVKAKSTNGTTIREKTEEYNRLVPAARKAGVTWAKHHTSNFESQDKADVALKKLKDAMKKAGG